MSKLWKPPIRSDELYHYGVKGMKWRKRKGVSARAQLPEEDGAQDTSWFGETRNNKDLLAPGSKHYSDRGRQFEGYTNRTTRSGNKMYKEQAHWETQYQKNSITGRREKWHHNDASKNIQLKTIRGRKRTYKNMTNDKTPVGRLVNKVVTTSGKIKDTANKTASKQRKKRRTNSLTNKSKKVQGLHR